MALIQRAWRHRVPVPEALGFCENTSVTGARFYVMGT